MEAVFTAVIRHVDFSVVKCLVIAGPGFAKDSFREFLDAEAVRREIRCVGTPSTKDNSNREGCSSLHCPPKNAPSLLAGRRSTRNAHYAQL